MARPSGSGPVTAAFIARVRADATLAPILKGSKVYVGKAQASSGSAQDPAIVARPYVVLLGGAEDGDHVFGAKGSGGVFTGRIASGVLGDSAELETIYARLIALFDGFALAVTGLRFVSGTMSRLLGPIPEPDDSGMYIVFEYRYLVRA